MLRTKTPVASYDLGLQRPKLSVNFPLDFFVPVKGSLQDPTFLSQIHVIVTLGHIMEDPYTDPKMLQLCGRDPQQGTPNFQKSNMGHTIPCLLLKALLYERVVSFAHKRTLRQTTCVPRFPQALQPVSAPVSCSDLIMTATH